MEEMMNKTTLRLIKRLRTNLGNILPYAENEGRSLDELAKGERDVKADADRAWRYLDKARKTFEFVNDVIELNDFKEKR